MITKSMSRKTASFGQLLDYITREKDQNLHSIRHNLFGVELHDVRHEFEQNAELLRKRRGSNYLYHEILSMTRAKGISEAEQKEKLRTIAEDYIAARCPDNLVFGGLHRALVTTIGSSSTTDPFVTMFDALADTLYAPYLLKVGLY